MSQEQLRQVEIDIKVAQKSVQKADLLDKLYESPAFKTIIAEGYMKEEAQRLVMLKADPAMQTEQHQARISAGIDAIGYLNQYFRTIFNIGDMSEKALKDDIETREELMSAEG